MERILKPTNASANNKKKRLSIASQPQQFTQSQPRNMTQRRVQPLSYQQPPLQLDHATRAEHPTCKVGQDVASSQVKKTRGITRGVGTHVVVNAAKKRIPIRMDHEQKLPKTIQANAMFSSEIGSLTRKRAPLIVKTWKKVSKNDKTTIITTLTTKFEFDETDPDIMKYIEDHMAKSYRQWKCKIHKHFKLHADNLEYARAHPPPEKLWGKRQMVEWEYLCDELFTTEDYQKRCKTNAENRSNLKYNHCGGSRPFQKHMEAALEKGKDMTIVENWGIMHQHQGGLGAWVNDEAENIGKKMLDELEKEKQKLAEIQSMSTDEISVPLPTQLEILVKGVGVMKGKTIRDIGYGLQRETIYTAANSSSTSEYTTEELLSTMGKMALKIEELEAKFAAYAKANMCPPCDDGIGENDQEMDAEDDEDEEDHGYMH